VTCDRLSGVKHHQTNKQTSNDVLDLCE